MLWQSGITLGRAPLEAGAQTMHLKAFAQNSHGHVLWRKHACDLLTQGRGSVDPLVCVQQKDLTRHD